ADHGRSDHGRIEAGSLGGADHQGRAALQSRARGGTDGGEQRRGPVDGLHVVRRVETHRALPDGFHRGRSGTLRGFQITIAGGRMRSLVLAVAAFSFASLSGRAAPAAPAAASAWPGEELPLQLPLPPPPVAAAQPPSLAPAPPPAAGEARSTPTVVTVGGNVSGGGPLGPGGAVVWLKRATGETPRPAAAKGKVVTQRNKAFIPRVL